MALSTYSDLQTAVANHLDRSDLTSVIPDFIALFEANANTDKAFKTIHNRTSTSITTVVNQNYISLPATFMEAEAVILANAGANNVISSYGTAAALYTQFPMTTTGFPGGFITQADKLVFARTPDAAYTGTLYYYTIIPALSTTNTTNWLLTNYPNLYLYGTLVAAEAYLGMDARLQLWGNLYDNGTQKLQGSTDRSKYSGGPVTVKFDAVV
jgi:hypothetical protein